MKRSLVVATAIALVLMDSAFTQTDDGQQIALPEGWNGLELSDLEGTYYYDVRATKEAGYLSVNGDFDGNGLEDIARLLVNADDSASAVFISLQEAEDSFEHHNVVNGDLLFIQSIGLNKVEPGTYRTACGKGYGRCAADAPTEFVVLHDAVEVFAFESASSYVYWDGTELSREFITD